MTEYILTALYLSVYLTIGAILAEIGMQVSRQRQTIKNPKSTYVLITCLWPLCVLFYLYESRR